MDEKLVPKRRFVGFTADWEQFRLGDLGSVTMNKRIFKDETKDSGDVPFYKIGTFGREPDAYISQELFEEYKVKYPYPEVGDILISASGSIGRTVVYKGEDAYFQDSNIVWLKHDDRLDNSFLKQFYTIVEWQGLEGSTIKRLYNKNILDTEINIPTPNEQKKIGEFFANLDNLIASQQRKLNKTKAMKSAYLSEMFPADGECKPKRRFAGFTADWEQSSWRNTVDISTNMVNPQTGEFDDLAHIGPGNIESFSGRLLDNVKTVKEDNLISGKFHFNKGDVIYGKINPQLGKYVHAQIEGLASADAYVLNAKNGLAQRFLFALIQTKDFFNYSVSVSMRSGMPKINREELNLYNFYAPTYEEQKKIGEFFANLDNLIASQQQKLEKLQNMKKAYLNEMFI